MQSNPLGDLFKQFQDSFAKLQAGGGNNPLSEALNKEVEGSAGAGAVKVKITGAGEVTQVIISPDVVDKDDIETLQDLIVTALGDARQNLQNSALSNVKNLTNNLGNLGNLGNLANLGNLGNLGNIFGNLFGAGSNNSANPGNQNQNSAPNNDSAASSEINDSADKINDFNSNLDDSESES